MPKNPPIRRKWDFLLVLGVLAGLFGMILTGFGAASASAQTTPSTREYQSAYVGQETRAIKSLSKEDIESLREGKGWGLAKAAELNGAPGPAHLLEMKEEIQLTGEQIAKIQEIRSRMKKEAMRLGRKFIQLEEELNQRFAKKTIDYDTLRSLLQKIEKVRAELRYTHLAAHLRTPPVLTSQQITHYRKLRGYGLKNGAGDSAPAQNPAMHKGHQR